MPALIVATGAFDCGKTTTLEWLREHHGLRIHTEAHRLVLRRIATRSGGHPPERGFTRIEDPDHFCPMCRPLEFCELVLAEQRALEQRAREGDLLERGYLDPLEMFDRTRRPGQLAPSWDPVDVTDWRSRRGPACVIVWMRTWMPSYRCSACMAPPATGALQTNSNTSWARR